MTCIVGLVHDGDVYIGGDSAGVAGLSLSIRADEKVFGNGPFIMGFTTSFRMGQLLRYKFAPPAQTVHQDDMEYMVTSFVDACRQCFSGNGFGDKEATVGGNFLVGYKGKLYNIEGDYQVGVPRATFDAVGCGTDLALGAMFATEGLGPEDRINAALAAASTFSAGVAPPFTILRLEGENKKPKAKPKAKKPTKKPAK
jgi:ATP-dependent protease HslVU (ClpYQ) peptidase subunit